MIMETDFVTSITGEKQLQYMGAVIILNMGEYYPVLSKDKFLDWWRQW